MASCAKIDVPSLRHRIEIQSVTRTEDGAGGFGPRVWSKFTDAWASIDPVSAWEKFQASQMETPITHKIVMRYQPGIITAQRIKFGERYFNIVEVLNIEERNVFLKITAVEGAAT